MLNQTFEISPEEARDLWIDGKPLPEPEDGGYRPDKSRVLWSADGQWVVRRIRLQEPPSVAARAAAELERLQEFGVDVISRGLTPSPGGETVFTVSPYIAGLVPCGPEVFEESVAPRIGRYLGERAGNDILSDLHKHEQYSLLPGDDNLFLHDPDPYMATQAAALLAYNSRLL